MWQSGEASSFDLSPKSSSYLTWLFPTGQLGLKSLLPSNLVVASIGALVRLDNKVSHTEMYQVQTKLDVTESCEFLNEGN